MQKSNKTIWKEEKRKRKKNQHRTNNKRKHKRNEKHEQRKKIDEKEKKVYKKTSKEKEMEKRKRVFNFFQRVATLLDLSGVQILDTLTIFVIAFFGLDFRKTSHPSGKAVNHIAY